jgi:RNA polymerase sigma-70 factor (ECF subfamily)
LIDQFSENSSFYEPSGFTDGTLNPEQKQSLRDITKHLDLLDANHKEILLLKYIHDMSITDIAQIMNISENATSVRLHRAAEHARKKLSYLYE